MESIKEIVSKVIESEEHSNGIVDLLKYLETSEDNELLIKGAIDGLVDIFVHYLTVHYEWFTSNTCSNEDSITFEYILWFKSKYNLVQRKLVQLLQQQSIQIYALDMLMKLLEWEGKCHQKATPTNVYNFPNYLCMQVLQGILTCESSDLIGRFVESYLSYQDIKYFTLQNLTTIINKMLENPKVNVQQHFINNVYTLIKQISDTTNENNENIYYSGDPSGRHSQQSINVTTFSKYKIVFTNCWLCFLQLKLSSSIHKKVLVSLHKTVMPHFTKPHLLVDFLVGSYDQGGIYSILALNGLFILMHHYHLDYPNFYQHLYSLLQSSIFYVKYMPRFMKLLNVFLSSSHLPLYLVAAFAKKLSRLAITAPPHGVIVSAVIVINLLKIHPNCKVLLHRANTEIFEIDCDPFVMEEDDPSKCNALESCLWEMKTLSNHYHPQVSSVIIRLLDPEVYNGQQIDLQQYLESKIIDFFKEVEEEEENSEVEINFISPTNLWDTWT